MLLFALAATSPAHRVPWLEKWLLGVNKGYFGVDSVREKLIIVSGFFGQQQQICISLIQLQFT
jgi:hypothetical protein